MHLLERSHSNALRTGKFSSFQSVEGGAKHEFFNQVSALRSAASCSAGVCRVLLYITTCRPIHPSYCSGAAPSLSYQEALWMEDGTEYIDHKQCSSHKFRSSVPPEVSRNCVSVALGGSLLPKYLLLVSALQASRGCHEKSRFKCADWGILRRVVCMPLL